MREIKFRAIDKLTGNIIDWNKLMIDDIGIWMKSKNGTHSTLLIDAELIQYTGLEDKNGKPIFEGDIVNLFGGCFEIVFYGGSFGYWIWEEKSYRNFIATTINNHKYELEVIGNIYENKELL